MQIDTPVIRRLRDRLLAAASPPSPDERVPSAALSPEHAAAPSPEQLAALERIGPLAEVLVLTMSADGDLAPAENAAVRRAIGVLTDELLPASVVDDLLGRIEAVISEQGRDARLEALASRFALDRADAETAFSLAAAVALSDGRVEEAERALIVQLRGYFGISAQRATALLEGASVAR